MYQGKNYRMFKNTLFVGDSHSYHLFANGETYTDYIVDITLNKLRKNNLDVFIEYAGYDSSINAHRYPVVKHGKSLISHINDNLNINRVVFSIGEIDVRFHLVKRLQEDPDCLLKIVNTYKLFLQKIEKQVIVCSITPPGVDCATEYSRNIEKRSQITTEINYRLKNLCTDCEFVFFDVYNTYVTDSGVLNPSYSDGSVHVHTMYRNNNLTNLHKILLET